MRCFFIDDRKDLGTVSFALLGVLIILLSIIAVSYFSRIERIEYENRLQEEKISELAQDIDKTVDTIKNHVHYLAVQSSFEGYRNERKNISDVFQRKLDKYLRERRDEGGWKSGGKTVTLGKKHHNLTLNEKMMETDSITPGNESRGRYEEVTTDTPGKIDKTNTSFCYKVQGELLLRIKNHDTGMELSRNEAINMAVDVPFPFLEDKMDYTDRSLKGKNSDLGRMVNYILTTLAQYRTLMGYGMEGQGKLDNSSLRSTDEIITKGDVELAVNLAFVLEMAYQYRSYDEESVHALINKTEAGNQGIIKDLIDSYLEKNSIDPADMMALLYEYGYDGQMVMKEDSLDINITAIIAQSINALVDQYIMKYFDYFGMTKGINALMKIVQSLEQAFEKIGEAGETFMDMITGKEDEVEINPSQVEVVKNWVKKTFQYAGLMNTNIVRSRYLPYDEIEGEQKSGFPELPEDFHKEYEIDYKVRLTSPDNRWYEYSCGHGERHRESEDTCNETTLVFDSTGNPTRVRCGAEEELVGYDYAVKTAKVKVDGGKVLFRSKDITNSQDEIWQKFYNEHYSEQGDFEIENITTMVKKIIGRFVSSSMDDKVLNNLLEKYKKLEIDPSDRRSIFSEIDVLIKGAIGDTMDYYQENPGEIVELVKRFLYDEDPKINDLKDLLNESYEDFTGGRKYIQSTSERTADSLLSDVNPFVDIEKKSTTIVHGGLDDNCDFYRYDEEHIDDIPDSDILDIVKDGGSLTGSKVGYLEENLTVHVEDHLQDIKRREVFEKDYGENHSEEDGLLIQAFDSYQYNTTIVDCEENKVKSTRSSSDKITDETKKNDDQVYSTSVKIQNITPDPATVGQDIVHFQSNISGNISSVEWISDIDGHLSNREEFNMSAVFMSPGEHVIELRVIDQNGFTHEDSKDLFINRPPKAHVEDISSKPAAEGESILFNSSSYDPDGDVISTEWSFGDGNVSSEHNCTHVYKSPGNYEISLNVTDDKGGYDVTSTDLLVDDAPRVVDIHPMDNGSWETDQSININFSEPVENTSLIYEIDEDVDFIQRWEEGNTSLVLEPDGPYDRYTEHNLTIKDVRDIDNGTRSSLFEEVSHRWRTKEYANVTGRFPLQGSADINVQTSVVLSFSERTHLNSTAGELFSIGRNWTGYFEENGTRLILDHDPFPSGSEVILSLDLSQLRADSDGSVISEDGYGDTNLTIYFETEEYDPPSLINTIPCEKGDNVSISDDVELSFDEEMNTSTLNVSFYPEVKNLTFDWNEEGDKVIIGHEEFKEKQNYTVFISCDDTDGYSLHPLSSNSSTSNPFYFTTEDRSRPEVISISPENGTEEFLTDAPVTILFNGTVDPDTIKFRCEPDPGFWSTEWNADRSQVNLIHADFNRSTYYRFTLLDIRDQNGNRLKEEVVIEFNTSVKGTEIHGNYLQRLVWSIISENEIDDSLFGLTEEFLKSTTSNMISSSQMSNLEYRLPLAVEQGFDYGKSGERDKKNLELIVDRYPKYLHLKENITISKAEGTHYTSVDDISSHPYKTRWKVHIPEVEVKINVSQRSRPVLTNGTSKGIWMNESYDTGFNLTVGVASGWAMAGVDYEVSQDILGSITNFLDKAWRYLKNSISYIIDCIQKVIDLFKDLVDRIKDHAGKFVEILGGTIKRVISEKLGPAVNGVVKNIDPENLKILDKILSILGLDLDIDVSPGGNLTHIPNADGKYLRFINISTHGKLFGTSFDVNLNLLETNVIAFGTINIGDLTVDWQADPLAEVGTQGNGDRGIYDSWFQCSGKSGTKDEGAYINLTVPERKTPKKEKVFSVGKFTPIDQAKIPIGPVVVTDIDMGAKIVYGDIEEDKGSLLSGLVSDTFRDTISSMDGTALSFKYIVKFLKTLISKFIDNLISTIKGLAHELSFFFQAAINGVQVVISFSINGGDSISAFVNWVVTKIKDLISSITDKRPSSPGNDFPQSIVDDTYLTVEMEQDDLKTYFSANLPALAAIAKKDIGRWSVEFGVDVSKYKLVAGTLEER